MMNEPTMIQVPVSAGELKLLRAVARQHGHSVAQEAQTLLKLALLDQVGQKRK